MRVAYRDTAFLLFFLSTSTQVYALRERGSAFAVMVLRNVFFYPLYYWFLTRWNGNDGV